MEAWQEDFEWLQIRHRIKDRFGKDTLPDLNAILFLIGIQELGRWQDAFTKEEKQDLMHIAACRLLSYEGYYEFVGRDADGWPHWRSVRPFSTKGLKAQEKILKENIIRYFYELEEE
ncbi:MAG: hypothetical protein R2824_16335 [Saprospiraceae bacterium]|nr:hypothetical protein [Lewinella sp.]